MGDKTKAKAILDYLKSKYKTVTNFSIYPTEYNDSRVRYTVPTVSGGSVHKEASIASLYAEAVKAGFTDAAYL